MTKKRFPEDGDVRNRVEAIEHRLADVLRSGQTPTVNQLRESYQAVLAEALQLFHADAGCLVFIDRQEPDFETIVAEGYGPRFQWWEHVQYGEGLVSSAASKGALLLTPDVTQAPGYVALRPATKSQASIPLKDRWGTFGVLALESDTISAFPESCRPTVATFGDAFQHLLREFHGDLLSARMASTFDQLNAIGEEENEKRRIELIMQAAASLVGEGEVAVLRRYGGRLVVTDTLNIDVPTPDDLEIGISEGQGYTCYVAHTQRPFYCKDTSDKSRYPYYRSVVESTRSQYTMPLLFKRELVGVLNVGSTVPYGFSVMDRRLLDIFAEHAANSLYYSRLFSELRTLTHQVRQRLHVVDWLGPSVLKRIPEDLEATFARFQDAVNESKDLLTASMYPYRQGELEDVNIPALVAKIIDELKDVIDEAGIAMETGFEHGNLVYRAVSQHLREVIRNVLWNAIEALAECDEKRIAISARAEVQYEARYLKVTVADTGRGILVPDRSPAESVRELLSPGSKRPVGRDARRGRGLGLWICDHLLANYGGYLDLNPGDKGGTVVAILLREA